MPGCNGLTRNIWNSICLGFKYYSQRFELRDGENIFHDHDLVTLPDAVKIFTLTCFIYHFSRRKFVLLLSVLVNCVPKWTERF